MHAEISHTVSNNDGVQDTDGHLFIFIIVVVVGGGGGGGVVVGLSMWFCSSV